MADDNKELLVFDADTSQLVAKVIQAKGEILSMADSKNLSGLVEGLISLTPLIGAAVVAAYSLKTAFDAALETERIDKINNLFDSLSKSIGASTVALKEQFMTAAGGFATETDVLNGANRAMINMSADATKLPELLSLARRMTIQFGGDMIEKFNDLAFAIESGNQRMLKHSGIILDVNKVLREFAAANGLAADELSMAGRQQAIMNAAIDKGNEKFPQSTANISGATEEWKKFKTTISEVFEIWTKFFGKITAPIFSSTIKFLNDTENKYIKLLEYLGIAQKKQEAINDLQSKKTEGTASKDDTSKQLGDVQKIRDNRIKAEEEVLKFKEQANQSALRSADTEAKLTEALTQQRVLAEQEALLKIDKIENDIHSGKIARSLQTAQMEELINEEKTNKLIQIDLDYENSYKRMLDNQVKTAQNAANQFAAGWKKAVSQTEQGMSHMAVIGSATFNALNKEGIAAFQALGKGIADGSADAADIMKMFFLMALADIAEQYGEVLLAEGIGSGNPVAIAEGGSLIAMSEIIRSMAGSAGGGSSSSSSGGIGGGGVDTSSAFAGGGNVTNQAGPAAARQAVHIEIHGDLFDTGETARRITDLIRNSTDQTDYNYSFIGGQ